MFFSSETADGTTTITDLVTGKTYQHGNTTVERLATEEAAMTNQRAVLSKIGVPDGYYTLEALQARYANGKLA